MTAALRRWGILAVICPLGLSSTAKAEERIVAFSKIPPGNMELIRSLLNRDKIAREELLAGKIVISRDVRYAEVSLNEQKAKHLFILNEAHGWCGTDGCALDI
jgi:hypothetical protein